MSLSLSFTSTRRKALTKAERAALIALAHEHQLDLYVPEEGRKGPGVLAWGEIALDPDALRDEGSADALLAPLTALRELLPDAELAHEDDLGVVTFDDVAGRYVVGEGRAGGVELPPREGYVRALDLPVPKAKRAAGAKALVVPGVPADEIARIAATLAEALDTYRTEAERRAALDRLADEDPTRVLGVLTAFVRAKPIYAVGELVGRLVDAGADPTPWVAQGAAIFQEKRRRSGRWWEEVTPVLHLFTGFPAFDDVIVRFLLDTPAGDGADEERFYTAVALLGDLDDPRALGVALHRLRTDRGASVLTAERVQDLQLVRGSAWQPPTWRAPWRPSVLELLAARAPARAQPTLWLELADEDTSREACWALWRTLGEGAFGPWMQRFYEQTDRETTRGMVIPWPAHFTAPRFHSGASAVRQPELFRLNLDPAERAALEAEEEAVIAAELAKARG